MTKTEFAEAMALLSAAIDKPISKTTLAAWFEFLKDLPGNTVAAAVYTIIATDEYPTLPSIGKIRKTAITLNTTRRLTAGEAWGTTIAAIKNYGHCREREALESMPEEAAETARLMGWQQICHAENTEVVRGQYLRLYEAQAARRAEEHLLPPQARRLLEQAAPMLITGDRDGADKEVGK
ncbi:MAG TPA: replicative helicase loader/inhibitor [Dissulfurispiraceae bacterium]|nr:replicative helicase loader/inhibitor [Dissulfurispiraceae bacterium]